MADDDATTLYPWKYNFQRLIKVNNNVFDINRKRNN